MKRLMFLLAGYASLTLGVIGIAVPLLPTVPLIILAAFCFANSHPRLERWLLEHPRFGHHIVAWREHRAISRRGKWAATIAFAASVGLALWLSPMPWALAPIMAALVGGTWIWTRSERGACISTSDVAQAEE